MASKLIDEVSRAGAQERLRQEVSARLFQAGQALDRAKKDDRKNFVNEIRVARALIDQAEELNGAII